MSLCITRVRGDHFLLGFVVLSGSEGSVDAEPVDVASSGRSKGGLRVQEFR